MEEPIWKLLIVREECGEVAMYAAWVGVHEAWLEGFRIDIHVATSQAEKSVLIGMTREWTWG